MPKRIVSDVLWIPCNRHIAPVAFIKIKDISKISFFQGVCPWCGSNIDIPFAMKSTSTVGDLAEYLYKITGDHMPNCLSGDKSDPFNDLNVIAQYLN